MLIRIATMVLRVGALLALILGILFWTSSVADGLIPVHMLLGIIVVLSLWTIGIGQAVTKGGSWVLAAVAIVVGLLLTYVGLTQTSTLTGSNHWIIQVIHLLLALAALGVGEMMAARARRRATLTTPSSVS